MYHNFIPLLHCRLSDPSDSTDYTTPSPVFPLINPSNNNLPQHDQTPHLPPQTEFLPFQTYAQNHQLYPAQRTNPYHENRTPTKSLRSFAGFGLSAGVGIAGDLEIWAAEVLNGI